MISSTPEKLNKGLEKEFRKHFQTKMKKLQTLLLVESDTETNKVYDFTKFRCPELKLDEKIALGVISWYAPEELKWLIQFWIQENWGGEHHEVKDIILTSKSLALGYLLVQDRFNDSDFFGNHLRNLSRKINSDYFDFEHRKTGKVEKYTGYCRGYGETGTWSPHQPLKGLRKPVLTLNQMLEREEITKLKFLNLLELINSKLNL